MTHKALSVSREIRPLDSFESCYKIKAPAGYDGPKRVLVLADIHDDFHDGLLEFVRSAECDAIFIPGDMCNEHISGRESRSLGKRRCKVSESGLDFLKLCAGKADTYYSRGNHEWMFDDADISAIRDAGVHFLENEFVLSGSEAAIGALSSPLTYVKNGIIPECRKPDISWLEDFEKLHCYKILLCHHPEFYTAYLKERKIDLIISGHAHGGQIRIGKQGLYAPGQGLFPRYTAGFADGRMIISRGLSNTVKLIPRIGNKPEIVWIEFE